MPKDPTTTPSPVADFEKSLEAYERGVGLYRSCQQALEQAELRVKLLSDPDRPDDAVPFPGTSDDG